MRERSFEDERNRTRRSHDWVVVKGVCSRFNKWRESNDGGQSAARRKLEEPTPTRMEEMRRWIESGMVSTDVFKGPFGGAALEELTKMVQDLQIAQARIDSVGQSRDRRLQVDQRCMWCDVVGHTRRDSMNFTEALRSNVVYLWNGRVHASKTRRALELNIGRGGMKRMMEEAAVRHAETISGSKLTAA